MTETSAPRADHGRLDELMERAGHARRRFGLYKARVYGPKPTSPARLAQLERDAERAEAIFDRAKSNA
jgi:hypothetical protein